MKLSNLAIIKMLVLTALFLSGLGLLEGQFGGGNGTEEDPWQISRPEHLNAVRNYLGPEHFDKNFILTADIDLGLAPWNEGEGWAPLGTSWTQDGFAGTFDGQGHIIDNLFINRPGAAAGLFAYTGGGFQYEEGIVIKNLGLTNVNITGGNYVGGLAGWNRGWTVIENCYVTGRVTGNDLVGGLVGLNQNGNTTIINSYSRAEVTGQARVGGLVGSNSNNSATRYSYSTGRVRGQDGSGFTGRVDANSPVENCYWDIETSGQEESAGGDGRLTRQMVYPYDGETYGEWDFEDIWNDDQNVNDGYPILYYQDGTDPPDAPEVIIDFVTIDGVENVRIRWELIEDALSYKIYSSLNAYSDDWGMPVSTVGENITEYMEPIADNRMRYYHVTASSEQNRRSRSVEPRNRRTTEPLRSIPVYQHDGDLQPGTKFVDEDGNIKTIVE